MKSNLFAILTFVLSFSSIASGKPYAPISKEVFNLSAVIDILKNPKVKTVEDFISLLPEHLRDGRRMTMAYETHGLIPSSPEFPTFFLYGGPNSTVTLVFNSIPTGAPGSINQVELLSFDNKLKKHDLGLITFFDDKAPKLEMNPSKCVRCHGDTFVRPLFQSSYQWDGFFGSNEDKLSSMGRSCSDSIIHGPMKTGPACLNQGKHENVEFDREYFLEFQALLKLLDHPTDRSRHISLENAYAEGFDDGRPFSPKDHLDPSSRFIDFFAGLRGNNNDAFATKLVAQHASALARKIISHANYKKERYRIAYALVCDEHNSTNLRDKVLPEVGVNPSDWYMNTKNIPDNSNMDSFFRSVTSFNAGELSLDALVFANLVLNDTFLPRYYNLWRRKVYGPLELYLDFSSEVPSGEKFTDDRKEFCETLMRDHQFDKCDTDVASLAFDLFKNEKRLEFDSCRLVSGRGDLQFSPEGSSTIIKCRRGPESYKFEVIFDRKCKSHKIRRQEDDDPFEKIR